jgi:hypothetical protein
MEAWTTAKSSPHCRGCGVPPSTECPDNADTNCNDVIDPEDALHIVAFLEVAALPPPIDCPQVCQAFY